MEKNDRDYLLSSVKNAMNLLLSFSMSEPEKKVTDLATELGIGKSTVSRLLATLASGGFVIRDPETQKYRLGLSILHLNTILTSNLEINRESQPILQKLVHEVGETAHISAIEESDVIYLKREECKHPVQILTHVGKRNPAHCTGSGKLLLAFQPEDEIEHYIEKGLPKFTAKTITDPDDLRATLQAIREQEYSVSIEEISDGVASIAAPIRDYTGKVVYAVSVIGPVHRLNPYNPSIINKVKNAAKEISNRLGYRGN